MGVLQFTIILPAASRHILAHLPMHTKYNFTHQNFNNIRAIFVKFSSVPPKLDVSNSTTRYILLGSAVSLAWSGHRALQYLVPTPLAVQPRHSCHQHHTYHCYRRRPRPSSMASMCCLCLAPPLLLNCSFCSLV